MQITFKYNVENEDHGMLTDYNVSQTFQQQQQQPLLEYRRSHDKQRSQHTFEIKTNKLILWSGPKYGNCPFLSTKF